jgi:hypothetical protein
MVGRRALRAAYLPGGTHLNPRGDARRSTGVGYLATLCPWRRALPTRCSHGAVKAGAKVVREIRDSPVGTRGFVVSDPEGLFWSVGTPLPALVRDASGPWRPAVSGGATNPT